MDVISVVGESMVALGLISALVVFMLPERGPRRPCKFCGAMLTPPYACSHDLARDKKREFARTK